MLLHGRWDIPVIMLFEIVRDYSETNYGILAGNHIYYNIRGISARYKMKNPEPIIFVHNGRVNEGFGKKT